jgi:NADH:ubiquinone oxidoreductase subunit
MIVLANFRDPNSDPYLVYIQEKYKDKPFTFWYDKFPTTSQELNINPYNFLFLHEPNEFFGMHTSTLNVSNSFTAILTWNDLLLHNLDNSVCFTYSGQTLDNEFVNNIGEKEFNVSFLCGTKVLVEGHKLRQEVYKLEDQIKIPKKWYYVLEDYDLETNTRPGYTEYSKDLSHIPEGVDPISYGRRVLFNNSMFNVVIENVNYNNWYNKIGDNFATKTVPIYWGCPNISDFGYDERGIIRFNTPEELLEIINNLTPEKYKEMLPYIEYNYELVKQDTFENNINQFFDNFIELNNL